LLNVNDESVIIDFLNNLTKFRSTMIKSYYDDNHDFKNSSSIIIDSSFTTFVSKSSIMSQSNVQFTFSIDQNSEFEIFSDSFKRDRDRLRKYLASIWVSCSIRLMILISFSLSFSLQFRYSFSLSFLSSIRLYTSLFLNLQRSDKKKSTISSKRMFFDQ
jgi:hypothetical protein